MFLPNKDKILKDFLRCSSWEEKYIYIIELGNYLGPLPNEMRVDNYLVSNCQSQVWIVLKENSNRTVKLYGDSDSSIVKGLITIVFSLYQNLKAPEIIDYDIKSFLNMLNLSKHLTSSRSQGLDAIINSIRIQAAYYL